MDLKYKKNVLRQLAKKREDVAVSALEKEAEKISYILNHSTDYRELADSLELLDIIAYRVHGTAVIALKDFLSRETSIELTHGNEQYPNGYLERYQNFNRLAVEAIKTLEHIRYHEPDRVIKLLFAYSKHQDTEISEQATKSLVEYAKFHLEVFYANEQGWAGLGPQPQEKLVDYIDNLNDTEKREYFSVIRSVCREMLSATLEGTSWTYKTVTLSTGSIQPTEDIRNLRRNTLEILKSLYFLSKDAKEKISVLGTMYESGRTPHQTKYSDELLAMTVGDALVVLEFVKSVVTTEELEVVQDIEHDIFWQFRRGRDEKIQTLALEIKDIIDANQEYQIFKILIGFQGIFSEWRTKEEDEDGRDFQKERELRQNKANEFAASITDDNFPEWKERILSYSKIQSDDLATFPYFGQFLEAFGSKAPRLAIKLLEQHHAELQRFLVAILSGLWKSNEKETAEKVIISWIEQNLYLYSLARLVGYLPEFNDLLLTKIFVASERVGDIGALIQVVSSVSAHYKESNPEALKDLFIPAIQALTKHDNSNWVYDFWFRQEKIKLFADLSESDCSIILENLLLAKKISYQHEEVLAELAKYYPEAIIYFFCDRMDKDAGGDAFDEKYEAVPFSFHSNLAQPLSKIPRQAIDIVFKRSKDDYLYLMFRAGKLLSNIFSDLPQEFSEKLIELIHQKDDKILRFVLGVLRNYDGDPRIQYVCKELIKILPTEGSLLNETIIALQSTGVVSGEFGFAEAYKTKIEQIKPWINDDNEKVRNFAKNYIVDLEKQIIAETLRAQEGIALRKHQYGDDNE